ncbi:HD domain-containing protein [Bacteroidota bacterium]
MLGSYFHSAEEKWLDKAKKYVSERFEHIFLPSHDLDHHLRTWQHAKVLLEELVNNSVPLDASAVEAVFLACMFHDTGMVITPGKEHGILSRELYRDFISKQDDSLPESHEQVLKAIEFHDQKDLSIFRAFKPDEAPDILTITGIADDMDALGIIGIYRYTEIYLHREIAFEELGTEVLANVSKRFENISRAAAILPAFLESLNQLYNELTTFFENYQRETSELFAAAEVQTKHMEIISLIKHFCIDEKKRPEIITDILVPGKTATFTKSFFERLKNEILFYTQ